MKKVLISVMGNDQPGIMATVAEVINQRDGNIENLSQTLLNSVFGALLLVDVPATENISELQQALMQATDSMALFISVHQSNDKPSDWYQAKTETQPYIVTVVGPDRHGIVAEVTSQLFKHGVNITNMQAIFKGGKNPLDNLMVFEIDVPKSTVMNDLRDGFSEISSRLDLEVSVQHRKIFDSVSNILN